MNFRVLLSKIAALSINGWISWISFNFVHGIVKVIRKKNKSKLFSGLSNVHTQSHSFAQHTHTHTRTRTVAAPAAARVWKRKRVSWYKSEIINFWLKRLKRSPPPLCRHLSSQLWAEDCKTNPRKFTNLLKIKTLSHWGRERERDCLLNTTRPKDTASVNLQKKNRITRPT